MDVAPEPQHASRLYAQAMTDGRAGHWRDAGAGLARAFRYAPDQPRIAQALLECGLRLFRQGQLAPSPSVDTAPASGRISFVICSIDPDRLKRVRADLDKHFAGDDWELVHLDDARSLAEGYTRGLARAVGDFIVFCHDDIGIVSDDFPRRLRVHLASADLIGLAGSNRAAGPSWHWAGPPHTASRVAATTPDGRLLCTLLGAHARSMNGAQTLDGVFLAGPRRTFELVPFDAITFDGFHFYDIDMSYRASRAGLRCRVALDLVIWHQSGGNFGDSWRGFAERFVAKHPELGPRGPSADYQPGAAVVESTAAANAMYAWVDRWLST
jgi:hypothetical protein